MSDLIIKNLASFNPEKQFLTTNLKVEDKQDGLLTKYSIWQTIKRAFGCYDIAKIGEKLNELVGEVGKTNNPEPVVDSLLELNRKVLNGRVNKNQNNLSLLSRIKKSLGFGNEESAKPSMFHKDLGSFFEQILSKNAYIKIEGNKLGRAVRVKNNNPPLDIRALPASQAFIPVAKQGVKEEITELTSEPKSSTVADGIRPKESRRPKRALYNDREHEVPRKNKIAKGSQPADKEPATVNELSRRVDNQNNPVSARNLPRNLQLWEEVQSYYSVTPTNAEKQQVSSPLESEEQLVNPFEGVPAKDITDKEASERIQKGMDNLQLGKQLEQQAQEKLAQQKLRVEKQAQQKQQPTISYFDRLFRIDGVNYPDSVTSS